MIAKPVKSIPWSDTLSPDQLRTLIVIMEAVHFGEPQPTIHEIAEKLNGNRNCYDWVRKNLVKLREMGLVSLKRRRCRGVQIKCRVEFFPESGLKGSTRV